MIMIIKLNLWIGLKKYNHQFITIYW
jgi:hypothetical protein